MSKITAQNMTDTVEFRWDPPGLPPRSFPERCKWHPPVRNEGGCAFRDDDPTRCEFCHIPLEYHTGDKVCNSSKQGYFAADPLHPKRPTGKVAYELYAKLFPDGKYIKK